MNCDLCGKSFQESLDGLITLTFHKLVGHIDKDINGYETKNEYGEDWVEY